MALNRVRFTNQTEISSQTNIVHRAKSVCCFWVTPHSIPTMVNPLPSPLTCRFYSLVDTHLCPVDCGSKGVWLRRGDPPWMWMIPSSGLVSLGWRKGDLEDSFGVPAFLSLCFLTWCSWQAAPCSHSSHSFPTLTFCTLYELKWPLHSFGCSV